MMKAPPPAPAVLLSSSPLASVPRLLLSWPGALAAASCRAAPAPGVARSISVSVVAPAAAAEIASASASTAPRRRLILLRHGESAAGTRSTRVIHRPASSPLSPSGTNLPPRSRGRPTRRRPMPLLRGVPPCAPRAPSGRLGGGSSLAQCCLPLRRACFLQSADGKNGCALSYQMKNTRWTPIFALETGASPSPEGQDVEEDADAGFLGRTRLGRLIQAAASELLGKLNSARTNPPLRYSLCF